MTRRRSRASAESGARYSSTQLLASLPRPTRPRSWCSCASPMRSAFSITMSVAFGTSTPTSITVVATSSWIRPLLNASIAESRAAAGMRPCTSPTFTSGSASARRAAVSSAACARSSSDSSISGQTQ